MMLATFRQPLSGRVQTATDQLAPRIGGRRNRRTWCRNIPVTAQKNDPGFGATFTTPRAQRLFYCTPGSFLDVPDSLLRRAGYLFVEAFDLLFFATNELPPGFLRLSD